MHHAPSRAPARRFTTTLSAVLGAALIGSALVPAAAFAADGPRVVINETYLKGGSAGAPFTDKFVELYNAGDTAQDLTGWSLQYRPATRTDAPSAANTQALSGSIAPGGYYLISIRGNGDVGADLPTPDATSTGLNPSGTNGQLFLANVTESLALPAGDVQDPRVVDFLGYGSAAAFETAPAVVDGPNGTPNSLVRTDFSDTGDNSADFTNATTVTPRNSSGAEPEPEPSVTPTTEPTTPAPTPGDPVAIREIQGTGASSPLAGTTVTTRGVVTAAYPTGGYNGFYIQTPGTGGAIDVAAHTASDAIFVFGSAATAKVKKGDFVEVTGVVSEYKSLTEISASVDGVRVLDEVVAAVQPAAIAWPATEEERESFEGMLLAPTGEFTVTNNYDTNRFAVLGLASGATPLRSPTDVARPGTTEYDDAVADNDERGVILDDGASVNYLTAGKDDPLPYLSLENPVRVGAAVTFETPVILEFRNDVWTFQPTEQLTVDNADTVQPASFENTRKSAPEPVGGNVKISSFNVLNYFTTTAESVACTSTYNDRAGNPITARNCPDNGPRGAANDENLQRQQAKIVAAINGLGADVVSLEEIENSAQFGKDRDAALSTLVGALNVALGSEQWAFVPSPAALPAAEDVIRTAFIYKKAVVEPVGDSVILDDPAFRNARQPLAQAFAPVGDTDATILAIVNHFKSKGDSEPKATGDNADDGIQGAFNGDRVRQAEALGNFAEERSAALGTDEVFLLGDFNSYTQEDPIEKLRSFGFEPLETGTGKYSYSYEGQSGSLDHVLASPSARELVTGTDIWNINAVEALALEYSRYNYNALNFYETSPYRSSDHDPVIVGLDLSSTTDINLLGINDFHGRIDANTVKFAGTVEQLRAQHGDENTLFLSNGDNIGASLFASSLFQDEPTIDVLNALELAASGTGNHEFDKGAVDLTGRVSDRADFPYLAANVFKDGQPLLPAYAVFEVDGVRVGVIGAVTQQTPTLVSKEGIQGIEFRDPVTEVNRVVAEIDDQVDVIVAQYHEGTELSGSAATLEQAVAEGGAFAEIVNETDPAVDAIFTGHTHAEYVWDAPIPGGEGTRPILQTGSYGANVGQIVLTVDDGGDVVDYTARNVPRLSAPDADAGAALDAELVATYPRVAEVNDIVTAARAEADVVGREPVGSVTADITTAFQEGGYVDGVYAGGKRDDRSKQSALGGLVADALRETLADPERGGADIAVVNPGGLRAELLHDADGVITLAEANAVLPFVNNLWTTTLTGEQLRVMFEQQWGDASGRGTTNLALGVSENVRFTYDASRPAGERVLGIWIDGVAVEPAAEYRVGSFSFLLGGGDNFSVFQEGANTLDSGLVDRDGWIDYLRTHPGLVPDFTARGVQVSGVPAEVTPGEEFAFTVSDLDLTSLGAPQNTSLRASFGAGEPTEVPVLGGTASVTAMVPADALDVIRLQLEAQPTGTLVTVPLRLADAATVGGGGGDTAVGGGAGASAGDGALAITGTDGAWMGAGVLAALALLGLGVAVRRRSVRQTD